MSAAPSDVSSEATIMDNELDADGKFVVLREGTNGWYCFPDLLTTPGNDPVCNDQTWLDWNYAFFNGEEPDPAAPGQESVWDYPRPAIAEPSQRHIRIVHQGVVLADTRAAWRTLETSHPPTYYLPQADIAMAHLEPNPARSLCEWKGQAHYWDVVIDELVLPRVGWSYPRPTPRFEILKDHIAFYAQPFDRCSVDGEIVVAQAGGFYGGWITSGFAGPFKGGPGTSGW